MGFRLSTDHSLVACQGRRPSLGFGDRTRLHEFLLNGHDYSSAIAATHKDFLTVLQSTEYRPRDTPDSDRPTLCFPFCDTGEDHSLSGSTSAEAEPFRRGRQWLGIEMRSVIFLMECGPPSFSPTPAVQRCPLWRSSHSISGRISKEKIPASRLARVSH